MINEVSIRCFLTLAETLSFTETAKQTFMTQQSVSKYIAKLEEDLGFQLFIRTHHYVMITKAGENFYQLFHKLSEDFDTTMQKTRRYYDNLHNSLHIGYLEWLSISENVSSALNTLKEENPDLRFIGEKHPQYELNQLFLNHKLDLIITYREFAPKSAGIRKLKILDTPLLLMASPDNPLVRPGAAAADFKNEPFIKAATSRESLSETKTRARRQCREIGFTPSEIIVSPNLESAYMAVEFGQGVMASTQLSMMSMRSEVVCYDLDMYEQLLCFWHEDQENPMVLHFAKALEESCRQRF